MILKRLPFSNILVKEMRHSNIYKDFGACHSNIYKDFIHKLPNRVYEYKQNHVPYNMWLKEQTCYTK
jgi:hypothetical protein